MSQQLQKRFHQYRLGILESDQVWLPFNPYSWVWLLTALILFSSQAGFLLAQEPGQGAAFPAHLLNGTSLPPSVFALVEQSGVIFAGRVASIERQPVPGWIHVRFDVALGVRGVAPGLWEADFVEGSPGSFPLRPGEQLVALLHARNAAGITSFVGKGCGLFERTGADHVDLRRLRFCPAVPEPIFPFLLSPVVFWPEPRPFFPEQPQAAGPTDIVNGISPRTRSTEFADATSTVMTTGEFVRLLSEIGTTPAVEPHAVSHRDLPGTR